MKEMWRLVELIAKIVTNLLSLEVQKVSGKHPPPCKGPSSDQVAILQPVTRVSANHPVAVAAKMVYQSERFQIRPSQLLLPHLLAAGMITLPTPPMKNPTPRILNSSPRCDFHSGMIGHATDQCYTLQHKIQNLLSQNLLAFEQKPVEPTEPAKARECASSIDEVPPWFYSTAEKEESSINIPSSEPQLEGIQQPQLLPSTGTDPNEHLAQAMSSRELQEVFDYDAIPQEVLQWALSQNDQVAAIQTPSAPLTDSTIRPANPGERVGDWEVIPLPSRSEG